MNKPLMIAHRGYSKFEKENTLVSFSVAGGIDDYYGIETDVHVTNDGHYITIHDELTGRITNNAININVEENNYETVANVRLPDVDGSYNRYDIRIPEMIEYFKICKKYNKKAICELKQVFTKDQIAEIIKIIDSVEMLQNTIFISFIIEDLYLVRELNKDVPIQLLLCTYDDKFIPICKEYKFGIDIHHMSMTEERVKLLHDNGIEINLWTVDDQDLVNKYAKMGVDYITSNCIKKVTQ